MSTRAFIDTARRRLGERAHGRHAHYADHRRQPWDASLFGPRWSQCGQADMSAISVRRAA